MLKGVTGGGIRRRGTVSRVRDLLARTRTRGVAAASTFAVAVVAIGVAPPLAQATQPSSHVLPAAVDYPIGGTATEVADSKVVYDANQALLANGSAVQPNDTYTYAIRESLIGQNITGATLPTEQVLVQDVMSSGQNYVPNSLTELSGSAPSLTITEPGTTNRSSGVDIALAEQWQATNQLSAGDDPEAVPVWGENSQYVEGVSSPDVVTTPVSTGDGMNPTIAYNDNGDMIAWSLTHHDGTLNRIGCVIVGSRESCTSDTNYWAGYATAQNVPTLTWDMTTG